MYLATLTGSVDSNSLNVIYNLADFVNKIAFGLVIWVAAMQSGNARVNNFITLKIGNE